MGGRGEIQVVWRREERTLCLEGEPVLAYAISRPEVEGGGLGGRWISRYYARLAAAWRRRWEREVYWLACLDMARCRQEARPFTPWQGALYGEVALLRDGLLSLRLFGEERRGGGKTNRVRWGDMWRLREGAPCSLSALLKGEKGWRRRLWSALRAQGEARRQEGECLLDRDWLRKARAARPFQACCLTEQGVEVALPQCAAAPAAEGCPVFLLPLEGERKG